MQAYMNELADSLEAAVANGGDGIHLGPSDAELLARLLRRRETHGADSAALIAIAAGSGMAILGETESILQFREL